MERRKEKEEKNVQMFSGNGHVVLNAEYINTFRKLAAIQTVF